MYILCCLKFITQESVIIFTIWKEEKWRDHAEKTLQKANFKRMKKKKKNAQTRVNDNLTIKTEVNMKANGKRK